MGKASNFSCIRLRELQNIVTTLIMIPLLFSKLFTPHHLVCYMPITCLLHGTETNERLGFDVRSVVKRTFMILRFNS